MERKEAAFQVVWVTTHNYSPDSSAFTACQPSEQLNLRYGQTHPKSYTPILRSRCPRPNVAIEWLYCSALDFLTSVCRRERMKCLRPSVVPHTTQFCPPYIPSGEVPSGHKQIAAPQDSIGNASRFHLCRHKDVSPA
jgi:hypothetical protein